MDPAAILSRVLDRPQVAKVMRVLDIYGHAAGGLLANGLAFAALFAAIPTTLLVLGVAGWITAGNPEASARVANALIQAFPPLAELINGAVDAMSHGAALTSLIGVVGVIWTVSQLYGALDVAFARIFAEAPERDMVRRTARGLLVVVLIGGAIVAFVVLVSLAGLIDAFLPGEMPIAQSDDLRRPVDPIPVAGRRARRPGHLSRAAVDRAALAFRAGPGDRGRDRDRGPQSDLRGAGPAAGGRGRAGRIAGIGVHRPGVAVVHVPGAALRGGLGAGPRRGGGPGRVRRPGESRSAGRTGRWRRVTGRN